MMRPVNDNDDDDDDDDDDDFHLPKSGYGTAQPWLRGCAVCCAVTDQKGGQLCC